MIISQNIPALSAQLNMTRANRYLAEATKRLSSGYRINSSKDDPTGMAIANKLSLQLAGIGKATDNASNGVALVQTAEGALAEVHSMLQRMRELAVQAATDTLDATDRDNVMVEVDQLVDEIQQTASRTEYNNIKILNGEGSRVSESHEYNGALPPAIPVIDPAIDSNVSTLLYISEDVPPGSMTYDITSVGEPAILTVGAVPAAPTVTTSGGFFINGIEVTVQANESMASAQGKINEAFTLAGISRNGNQLVSDIAGSRQQITITGDAGVLTQLGLAVGSAKGTDAKISNVVMRDISGNTISSGNALVASADGNQVSVKGSNGEVVNFNIQAISRDQPAPPLPMVDSSGAEYTGARNMAFEFKDYGPIKIQVGGSYNNNVSVYIPTVSAETLGLVEYKGGNSQKLYNYCTLSSAANAIGKIDQAIQMVSNVRSRLGAFVNRLDSTVRSLDVANENTESSRSRIQDTDMAKEMTKYSQMNVMYQAGIAILTQANQRPAQVLQMLN